MGRIYTVSKILYNQMLVKACQIDYEDGPISKEHTLIHTRGWHFENLQNNLKHDAIVCMAMGDCGFHKYQHYYIGSWSSPTYVFDNFNPHIKKIYCPHASLQHLLVEGVPCGVMFTDDGENFRILEQNEKLNIPKTKLLYVKFNPNTHFDRPQIFNHFKSKSWVEIEEAEPPEIYYPKMKQHKFVLCPRGNGPDCYRTWEALYMGCIPIVPSKRIDGCHHHFTGKLPILEVDSWDFTPQLLESIWQKWSKMKWQWELLQEEYWIQKIRKHHEDLLLS